MAYTAILCLAFNLQAQKPVRLEEAWQRATTRSTEAQFAQAVYGLAQAESRVGVVMPGFTTMLEAGQVNSAFTDTKITLSQSGYFPGYHKAFKNKQQSSLDIAMGEKQIKEWELRKWVTLVYVQYQYYSVLKSLYDQQGKLFQEALIKAQQRRDSGASDGTEVFEATAQLTHHKLLTMETDNNINSLLNTFRVLTGSAEDEEPASLDDLTQYLPIVEVSELVVKHPGLQKLDAEIVANQKEARWKRAQRQATWMIAISNTSFKGIGADNKVYDASSRFSSVQLGVNFPLFGSQASKTEEVIKLTEVKSITEKNLAEIKLKNQLNTALAAWQRVKDQLRDFESNALPLATQLMQIAENKLKAGEIDFMKYISMNEQGLALLLDYASLKRQQNEAALEYHFSNFN